MQWTLRSQAKMRAVTKIISTIGDHALTSAEDAESLTADKGKNESAAPKVSVFVCANGLAMVFACILLANLPFLASMYARTIIDVHCRITMMMTFQARPSLFHSDSPRCNSLISALSIQIFFLFFRNPVSRSRLRDFSPRMQPTRS